MEEISQIHSQHFQLFWQRISTYRPKQIHKKPLTNEKRTEVGSRLFDHFNYVSRSHKYQQQQRKKMFFFSTIHSI